ETLTKSFREVQSVLDLNRRLIQQVNDNHRSKIPRNLATNVELIREINAKYFRSHRPLLQSLLEFLRHRPAAAICGRKCRQGG
ncbi:protein early flowering 4, partial [Phtheirospermum japonicum]